MNSSSLPQADQPRFYQRGDYGKMPAPPTLAEKELPLPAVATAEGSMSTSAEENSRASFHGIAISPVTTPQAKTIRFVKNTLEMPSTEGWFPRIRQLLEGPLQALSQVSQEKLEESSPASLATSLLDSDKKPALLLADPEIASYLKITSTFCATKTLQAITENAPPSFWESPTCHEQLEQIRNRFFGVDPTITTLSEERLPKTPGVSYLNCRGVAQRAIKSALEFHEKMLSSPTARVPFDPKDVDLVAKSAAKAALEAYHDHYVTYFAPVARSYPELTFAPVSGVEFAPPTLETKAIFVESDVDATAKEKAQAAAIKTIAGFWEAAMTLTEEVAPPKRNEPRRLPL